MAAAASPLILLAESDAAVRRGFTKSLLQGAYRVVEVRNGLEAAARARAVVPDAVVANALLDGLDGLTLAERLKVDPPTQTIPFILLSQSPADRHRAEAHAIVDAIVIQPCTPETLRFEIDRLLRHARSL